MAVSATKTYSAAEVLTATDLNLSFTEVTDRGEDLGWPATKAKDFDGQPMVLDADADSRITAAVDDRIDLMLGGRTLFRFDGTGSTPVNGFDFIGQASGTAPTITAFSGTEFHVDINLVSKGTGVNQLSGNTLSGTDESQWVISRQVFGG